VGVGGPFRKLEGHVDGLGHERRRCTEVDADVGDLHLTRVRGAGLEQEAGLHRRERHGVRRVHRHSFDLAGVTVHAGRDVDGDARAQHGVDGARDPRGVALERAPEAGAEHGVDERVGAEQCALAQLAVDAAVEGEHVDAHSPAAQRTGRDVAVAAVVALPAHGNDPPAVRAAHLAPHGPRHGAPGPLHEHLDGRSRRDRAPVGLAHLGGCQHRLHRSTSPDGDGHRHRHRLAVRK
jgi:hypothetical protein